LCKKLYLNLGREHAAMAAAAAEEEDAKNACMQNKVGP
jgi:hypothetical protein